MLRSSRSFPYKLLLPATVVMLAVVLFPLGYSFWLSFRNMSLYHFRDHTFVGLEQFRLVLTEPVFWQTLAKSLIWTGVNVFFHVAFGVMLAVLLNGPVRGRTVFRTLLILPWAMPQYISALTWRGMFNYEYGSVNLILTRWFHLPAIPWLSDPTWAFIAPILTNIWLGFPFMMIVALGGLTSIPAELYEAAELDGASAWQRFTRSRCRRCSRCSCLRCSWARSGRSTTRSSCGSCRRAASRPTPRTRSSRTSTRSRSRTRATPTPRRSRSWCSCSCSGS